MVIRVRDSANVGCLVSMAIMADPTGLGSQDAPVAALVARLADECGVSRYMSRGDR